MDDAFVTIIKSSEVSDKGDAKWTRIHVVTCPSWKLKKSSCIIIIIITYSPYNNLAAGVYMSA